MHLAEIRIENFRLFGAGDSALVPLLQREWPGVFEAAANQIDIDLRRVIILK